MAGGARGLAGKNKTAPAKRCFATTFTIVSCQGKYYLQHGYNSIMNCYTTSVKSALTPNRPPDAADDHRIEVLDLIHVSDRDAVRARCTVRIGAILISNVKILLPVLASRAFVGWPSRREGDAWRPLIRFLSPGLEHAVTNAVISAWKMSRGR